MTEPSLHDQVDRSLDAGVAAVAAGQPELGLRWLDRAARLAPQSPLTQFMLAVTSVRTRPAEAIEHLRRLTVDWPEFRDPHFALAGALLRSGEPQDAARQLASALHKFSISTQPDHGRIASDISRRVAAPGWITLDGSLVLTLCHAAAAADAHFEVWQDGARLRSCLLPRGSQGSIALPLPAAARQGGPLRVTLDGVDALGSGLVPSTLLRVEALLLPAVSGRLRGHAWMPGVPDARPVLLLRTPDAPDQPFSPGGKPKPLSTNPLAKARAFSLPLPREGPVHVLAPDGRDVLGSPAFLAPAPPPALDAPTAGLDVIIPVVRGAADLRNCLASLRDTLPPGTRVVVVDDGSTDRPLLDLLRRQQRAGRILVLRHPVNRGYPAAINTGLRHAAGRDAVLLNADTVVPPGWLVRLAAAAHAAPDIGSATPLSNEASVVSYPDAEGGNTALRGAALQRQDRLCQAENAGVVVDLPTAIGYCMYVRADCLAAAGGFREDAFAQGYGEENDWCRRSAALGWRHVAAADVFVTHLGGRSFGPARAGLMRRNMAVLDRLHPGYHVLVQRFLAEDPLLEVRRRMDMARWQRAGSAPLVLLVSHNLGGGVTRFVAERCALLHAAGRRTLVVRPGEGGTVTLDAAPALACPNLRFRLPGEWPLLLAWLRRQRVERVELQHCLNHSGGVETLGERLGVPMDLYVHDNIYFCPRLTLVGRSGRYCGEPVDPAVCDACVAALGSYVPDAPPVAILRARSRALFATARQVVVPSQDTARRVRRYTDAAPTVRPWQDDAALPPRAPPGRDVLRVATLGAINQDKGLEVLRDCAVRAKARALPIEFVLIGFSVDDACLLDAGVFVTGKFAREEVASLLRRERPSIGFLPSVWPETWCYALTDMWEAGLDVLSFDLGAQAERIRATGRGRLLPLGVPPDTILATLLAMQRG